MSEKEIVLETMKKMAKPVSAGEVAKESDLDKKVVDKVFTQLKKEELITSPIRCKWEVK